MWDFFLYHKLVTTCIVIVTGNPWRIFWIVVLCLYNRGGIGRDEGQAGENGTVTGKDCPEGLFGIFCEVSFTITLLKSL